MELLPDLPDTVTGIKCKNPFIVQCPTCGDCYTSRAWTTMTAPSCANASTAGRETGGREATSVLGGSPVDAMRILDRTDPNRHIYRISTEEARTHTLEAA